MALKLGLKISTLAVLKHLVATDPDYPHHLQTVLAPTGWTVEEYYLHCEEWDFHEQQLASETVDALRNEYWRPQSKLLGDECSELQNEVDQKGNNWLCYHVIGPEDDPLTQVEMLRDYDYISDLFGKAGFSSEQLRWFISAEA